MSPYHSLLGLYFKEFEDASVFEQADCITKFFNEHGYVVVLADMRGTHNSDGCFDYGGPGDQADGHAVVRWMAGRSWSNGRVGMYGVSHVGMSQYATAVTAPPALKAIIPIAPITSFYRYLHNGGAHYETNMGTPLAYDYGAAGPPPTNVTGSNHTRNVAGSACNGENTLRGMSLDGDFTHYWRQRDYSLMAGRIKAAVFHVHGTLDQNVKMDHFTSMWRALERAKVPRKGLIGPWRHLEPAVDHWHLQALRWFEHWLQRNDTGMMREPTVRTFSQRRTERFASAPFAHSARRVLYASSGSLSSRPKTGEASYRDVPGLPRQLLMGAEGARLLYDSAPMSGRTRIAGVPTVGLYATIDRNDTNFVAHLYDVAPSGDTKYISRGYLDARHRQGLARGADVASGTPLHYRIELLAQDYELAKGHVLRLLLASSDSCVWLVDVQQGEACESSGIVSDSTAAGITVHEGRGRTRVSLPIGPLAGKRH
jgi:X-Pro dipeptidyl-peptidase